MLHPREGLRCVENDLVRYHPLHSCNGRQIVFHVVLAGDEDAVCRKEGPLLAIVGHIDHPMLHVGPLFQRTAAAELHHPPRCPFRHGTGEVIVLVEDGQIPRPLVGENVFLGLGILLHRRMHIQVVGREIGKHRNVRAGLEGHQLEGGQLQNGHVVLPHGVCL